MNPPDCRTISQEAIAGVTQAQVTVEQPRQVLHAAGNWLATNLADCGYGSWLKLQMCLQRRVGTRVEQIHFQPSKFNRTGESITTSNLTLLVNDTGLGSAHARLLRPHRGESNLWSCRTTFDTVLDYGRHYELDLTEVSQRVGRLKDLARKIREAALPWFAYTRDPLEVVDIPDRFLDNCVADIVEWLLATDARQPARTMMQRWLALDPGEDARPTRQHPPPWRTIEFSKGQQASFRGNRPATDYEWLGWVASQRLDM